MYRQKNLAEMCDRLERSCNYFSRLHQWCHLMPGPTLFKFDQSAVIKTSASDKSRPNNNTAPRVHSLYSTSRPQGIAKKALLYKMKPQAAVLKRSAVAETTSLNVQSINGTAPRVRSIYSMSRPESISKFAPRLQKNLSPFSEHAGLSNGSRADEQRR